MQFPRDWKAWSRRCSMAYNLKEVLQGDGDFCRNEYPSCTFPKIDFLWRYSRCCSSEDYVMLYSASVRDGSALMVHFDSVGGLIVASLLFCLCVTAVKPDGSSTREAVGDESKRESGERKEEEGESGNGMEEMCNRHGGLGKGFLGGPSMRKISNEADDSDSTVKALATALATQGTGSNVSSMI